MQRIYGSSDFSFQFHHFLIIQNRKYVLFLITITFILFPFIEQDAVGVTIVLLTCSYRGQEFVRVGYFINNDYTDPELKEVPPPKPLFDKLTRNILATKPRVTRFKINWDDSNTATNGELNMDEAAGSSELFDKNEASMEHEETNGDTMNGTDDAMAMDARLNENSNSLAMEC